MFGLEVTSGPFAAILGLSVIDIFVCFKQSLVLQDASTALHITNDSVGRRVTRRDVRFEGIFAPEVFAAAVVVALEWSNVTVLSVHIQHVNAETMPGFGCVRTPNATVSIDVVVALHVHPK